ncbi:MAG: aldo/keto reductase, partial [Planctomycetota bacterium]|nr:aldo/keto reductase [Planctomycetota bacterium]
EDGSVFGRIKRKSVIEECEASLKRLDVEAIDLYQMHWPDPDEDIEECWRAMVELKEQGKVREIGVSNHNVPQMSRLNEIHPVASLQPPYNLLNRNIEEEILPYCGEQQVGVICYSPMGKGLLTGGFSQERAEALDETDHRSRDPKFSFPQLQINLDFVEQIRPIADDNNRPLAQLSIAWTLRRSELTSAIVGVRKPSQIEQTAAAADWELGEDEIKTIELALQTRDQRLHDAGILDQGRV